MLSGRLYLPLKSKTRTTTVRVKVFLAAGQGIEPRSTVPETVVLPLHHPAITSAIVLAREIIL